MISKGGQLAPLKNLDPKEVLQRYLAEETSTQIAQRYGVTRAALSYFMLKHAEQEWKDAQVTKALQRKEKAEDLLETADNALDLTRAREQLRSAQWDLEKVCRRIYGQDVTPDQLGRVSITLNIGAQSGAGTTVEGEYCTAVEPDNESGQNNTQPK